MSDKPKAASDTVRRLSALEEGHSELRERMAVIEGDMKEIRTALGHTATKTDVSQIGASLSSKIDAAINGILRDALSAVPAKQMVIWTAVTAFIALAALALELRH